MLSLSKPKVYEVFVNRRACGIVRSAHPRICRLFVKKHPKNRLKTVF